MLGGKRIFILSAMVLTAGLLAGCAGTRTAGLRTHFVQFSEQQKGEYLAAKPGVYRIQEGDEISIFFSYIEDMNQKGVIVLSDGSLTLPGIDRVVVAGCTISEVDSLITSMYAKRYRNPDVSVIVESTIGRNVYVLGEVNDPGLHPVPSGGISILSAIGAAGGFSEDAEKSNTVLIRMSEHGYTCQEIDLSRFHTLEGVSYTGVGLEAYDVIYVPRSKVGDFAYFSSTILAGILDITNIISDVRYIESGTYGR